MSLNPMLDVAVFIGMEKDAAALSEFWLYRP